MPAIARHGVPYSDRTNASPHLQDLDALGAVWLLHDFSVVFIMIFKAYILQLLR